MVTVQFQCADMNEHRNPLCKGAWDSGFAITGIGFDLDFDTLTIYPQADGEMDYNHVLAVKSGYMNEDGHECGEIAWRIEPEAQLIAKHPELREQIGKVYGRVIVTSGARS